MVERMPSMGGGATFSVTRFVTRTSILNIVKEQFPDAYISGNQIILPTLPDDYQEGDAYAIRIFTTPSYTEDAQ